MLKEIIETSRLYLRKPTLEDAGEVFKKWAQDEDVTKYLTWKPHKTINLTNDFIQFAINQWTTNKQFIFIICKKENDEIIGLFDIRINNTKADFGYLLAKKYWNNGYMSEVVKTLCDKILEIDNIYRVWAYCDVENKGSAKVMQKAGMIYKGILKKYMVHPNISNEPRDCLCYAKVK